MTGSKNGLINNQLDHLFDLYNTGLMDEAEEYSLQLLEEYPQSLPVINVLGAIYMAQGELKKAVSVFDDMIAINPSFPEPYNNRGVALKGLGELERAKADYNKAISIRIDYVDAYYNLGNVLERLGNTSDAEKYYLSAIKYKPDYAQPYNNLGNIKQNAGDIVAAVECYQKAIEYLPTYPEAYNNLGSIKLRQSRLNEAEKYFRQAIKFMPNYAEAHHNLGCALIELGRLTEAFDCLRYAFISDVSNSYYCASFVHLMNFFISSNHENCPYVLLQESMGKVCMERSLKTTIPNSSVRSLYQQASSIYTELKQNLVLGRTQLYRGNTFDRHCDRHKKIFEKYNVIPKACFGCYKVTIEPRSVIELFKLLFVFDVMKLPNDNSRKCIVEVRPNVSGSYKGFIYCDDYEEAEEVLLIISQCISESIGEGVPMAIKRGCSEYYEPYPEYKAVGDNGSCDLQYDSEWSEYENNIDSELKLADPSVLNYFTHNHQGVTLYDFLVMRNWLSYAATIGDDSYRELSDSPMPVVTGLNRPKF
jgi:tetratricopeptide (TPR) repeat protein